jgi:TolA-binding protein
MKKLYINSLAVLCALLLMVTAAPAAQAHEGEDHGTTSNDSVSDRDEDKPDRSKDKEARIQAAREKAQAMLEAQKQRQETRQAKLSDAKLRLCEAREKNITTIMNRAITRAQNQVKLFDTIAERVKAFYADKGIVLTNYDELVAAIDQAKAHVESDIEVLKTLSFSCDSEDPKAEVEAFKEGLKNIRQSLQDYRTAVKDLIVGVKSAQGDES